MEKFKSSYKGGVQSREDVRKILRERYGEQVADNYDPETDVMTMKSINDHGLRVKSGQKAIRITCLCEKRNEDGEVIARFPRKVNLFHVGLQCEKAR